MHAVDRAAPRIGSPLRRPHRPRYNIDVTSDVACLSSRWRELQSIPSRILARYGFRAPVLALHLAVRAFTVFVSSSGPTHRNEQVRLSCTSRRVQSANTFGYDTFAQPKSCTSLPKSGKPVDKWLGATSILEVSLALRRVRQEAATYAGFASPD